jgi:large subunit ribosomal protein L11
LRKVAFADWRKLASTNMAKNIKAIVKLQIKAGQATPAPPVGTALGPHGLNLGEFCSKFNDATKDKMGSIIPVELTIYEDRTYDFKLKTPPASDLLRKAAGVEKGSGEPHKTKVGKITKAQIKEIAELKLVDLNANDVEQAMKIIEGTARSMGIEVVD